MSRIEGEEKSGRGGRDEEGRDEEGGWEVEEEEREEEREGGGVIDSLFSLFFQR